MNVPMTNSGAKEEVKLGLRKDLASSTGLKGLPVIEEKRPKIETVSRCVFWQSYKIFYFDSNLTLLCFAVCEKTDMLRCCSSHVWMISS